MVELETNIVNNLILSIESNSQLYGISKPTDKIMHAHLI